MAELNNTTRINTTIDSGLEEEFRELAFKTFGYKKRKYPKWFGGCNI